MSRPQPSPTHWTDAWIDTPSLISATLGPEVELESLGVDPDEWLQAGWDGEVPLIEAATGFVEQVRDNTYNGDNDLSADIVFSVLTAPDEGDWIYPEGEALVVLNIHRGGDPRGNYGHTRIYRVDSMSDFLSSLRLQWTVTRDGEQIDGCGDERPDDWSECPDLDHEDSAWIDGEWVTPSGWRFCPWVPCESGMAEVRVGQDALNATEEAAR